MEPPYQYIANELKAGNVIPFLGSAASIAGVPIAPSRLPDGKGLAAELIDRVGSSYPGEASDPLTKVSQFYEECIAGRTPLYKSLRYRFYETQIHMEPTPLASMLAGIEQPLLIVTTNYDPIVELAYQKHGRAYTVLTHVTNRDHRYFRYVLVQQSESPGDLKTVPAKALDLDDYPGGPIIYKIHGTFGDPSWSEYDTIIITENDYVDFLVMTGQKKFPPAMERAFQKHHILYLGYSLEDWNFRVLLRKLQENALLGQDYKSWAIQLKPTEMEKRFWEKRNVDLYDVDLCDFVLRLKSLL